MPKRLDNARMVGRCCPAICGDAQSVRLATRQGWCDGGRAAEARLSRGLDLLSGVVLLNIPNPKLPWQQLDFLVTFASRQKLTRPARCCLQDPGWKRPPERH